MVLLALVSLVALVSLGWLGWARGRRGRAGGDRQDPALEALERRYGQIYVRRLADGRAEAWRASGRRWLVAANGKIKRLR
jgi:hypothetical protein